MAVLLWAFIKGLAILLISGAILALAAVGLPRLLQWWEKRELARMGLEEPAPALPVRERLPVPGTASPAPAAAEPRPPLAPAGTPPPAAGEESLVAAAIALALTLHQEEPRPAPAWPRAEGPSPWALAGRWQAAARRLSLSRR